MKIKVTELLTKLNIISSAKMVYRATIFSHPDLKPLLGLITVKNNKLNEGGNIESINNSIEQCLKRIQKKLLHSYLICNATTILEESNIDVPNEKIITTSEGDILHTFCCANYKDNVKDIEKIFLDYLEKNKDKIWDDIITIISDYQKTEALYDKLFIALKNLQNVIPEKWDICEIEIDHSLIEELDKINDKNKENFKQLSASETFTKLTNTYRALIELIETEKVFIETCQGIQVKELETACINYYYQSAANNRDKAHDPENVKVITTSLALLKKFTKVNNLFILNFESALQGAADISKLIEKIFYIIGGKNFSFFYKNELVDLANAYPKLSPILMEISTAIKAETYLPLNKDVVLTAANRISTPFQRLARYPLTLKSALESIPELVKAGIEFSTKNIKVVNPENEKEMKVPLEDVNSLTYTMFQRRTNNANQNILPSNPVQSNDAEIQLIVDELNNKSPSERLEWIKNRILRLDKPNTQWKIRGFGITFKDQNNKEYTVTRHMAPILKALHPFENKHRFSQKNPETLLSEVVELGKIARDYKPFSLNFLYKRHPETQKLFNIIAALNPNSKTNSQEKKVTCRS